MSSRGILVVYSLATLFFINECKAPSNCIHNPTFRHSSLVSSSGVIWRRKVASYSVYPWDDIICQQDEYVVNKHHHPYSKHDYSYLYATLLGNVFDHSDCYSFFVRIITSWNNLPSLVVEVDNIKNFKNSLKLHMQMYWIILIYIVYSIYVSYQESIL